MESKIIEVNDRTVVKFELPDGTWIDVSIREKKLRVCGEHRIVLRPEASNLVFVETTK